MTVLLITVFLFLCRLTVATDFETAFCQGFARNYTAVAAATDIGSTLKSVTNATDRTGNLSSTDINTLTSVGELLSLAGVASSQCSDRGDSNSSTFSRRLADVSNFFKVVCEIPSKLCSSKSESIKPAVAVSLVAGEKLLNPSTAHQSIVKKLGKLMCGSTAAISCGDKKVVLNGDGSTTSTAEDS